MPTVASGVRTRRLPRRGARGAGPARAVLHLPNMRCVRSLFIAIAGISAADMASAQEPSRAEDGHVPPRPDPTARPVISAGLGVEGFLGQALRDVAGPGPAWNVRAAMGTPHDIRVELVYAGSSQEIAGDGMEGGRLVGHGVHALLRVNVAPNPAFEPFFYLGGGWNRFHVTGATGRELRSPDHVLEIPFGFGAARRFGRIVLDVRAGFSIMNGADLIPKDAPGAPEGETMHRAGARMNLGLEL